MTTVELAVSSSIFVLVLLTSLGAFSRSADLTRSSAGVANTETRAQILLHGIEKELSDAACADPVTSLTIALGPGGTALAQVADTRGFPAGGRLLINRGTALTERCDYADLSPDGLSFLGLTRGVQCTTDSGHNANAEVRWAAFAEALPSVSQANPPTGSFDGQAVVLGNTVAFKGDGTGFSFRIPVDPTNSTPPDYLVDGEVQWGSVVAGATSTNGFSVIEFVPRTLLDEASAGDLNRDGDAVDVFDVGQLRRRTWDATQPGVAGDDLGIGPTIVLQEQCNWGGDLDGDGFADPIFLWNSETRELSIRLFVVNETVQGLPVVRRVEALAYLRNPEA